MGGRHRTFDPARRVRPGAALSLAALIAALPVLAQQSGESLPGPDVTLDVTSGVVVSDNIERRRDPAGTSAVSTTRLDLAFSSRTRAQELTLRAGARLEFGNYADEDTADPGVQSPSLSLGYTRESRDAALSLGADYALRELDTEREEVEGGEDLIIDQGQLETRRLSADLALGRDGPVTYTAALSFSDRLYSDTTDPDLNDQVSAAFDQRLSLALNRATRLEFSLNYRERDEDDAEDTLETNAAARIGLNVRARSGLTASGSLGVSVEEVTQDGETDRQEAPVLSLSVTRPRPDGSLSASVTRSLDEQGSRTTLQFGRALALPRGSLDGTVGLTVGETDDTLRLIGSLGLDRPMPRGALSLSLSQEVNADEDSDFVRTSVGLGYTHELTRLSQLSLSMDLSAVDAVSPDEADRQRTRVQLAYRRQLTEDWSLNTGVRHLTARESDLDPIIENAVFANLSRRFDLRP